LLPNESKNRVEKSEVKGKKSVSRRFTQIIQIWLALMILSAAACALAGEKEYRAGWAAFVQPVLEPEKYPTAYHYHQAREQAISEMKAAAAEKTAEALESLGYFYFRDFQYRNAREQFEAALKRKGREPRLYYLLGQTKAVLLLSEPEKMREQCKEALEEFRRAAARDEANALPLFQAASVAFDADRSDLALPLVSEALKRPEYRLYALPVPQELAADGSQAAKAWWWVQSGLWSEMITRTANSARGLLRQADRLALSGEEAQAEEAYRQAEQIGQMLYRANPPLAESLAAGLEIERQALSAQIGNRSGVMTAERTRLKQIDAARRNLERLWKELQEKERLQPPAGAEAWLNDQKSLVEAVLSSL